MEDAEDLFVVYVNGNDQVGFIEEWTPFHMKLTRVGWRAKAFDMNFVRMIDKVLTFYGVAYWSFKFTEQPVPGKTASGNSAGHNNKNERTDNGESDTKND